MSKKQITPEEYKAKLEIKKAKSEHFSKIFLGSIAVFLSCVMVFSMVSISYTIMAGMNKGSVTSSGNNVQENNQAVENEQDDPTADWGEDVVGNDPAGENTDENENNNANEEKKPYSTIPEIVELFNTAVNRVKPEATKVIKNYEKRTVNKLELPSALESMSDTFINDVMKDDTEPIVYATKQEIRDNYIVPNQDYSSKLKASDVEKAVCKDNGKEYEVYILVKSEKNPSAGSGVGAVFDVIESNELSEKAPAFLKEFSTEYYNCVVKVNIDKETGRVTHANYSTPLSMNIVVNMLGTHSVAVGVTFEKDYTIYYE
ncbi:MAG: hypothetical protein IKV25_02810 [Clostridia bacterium]|nr:hypothetical protein [Clostridia bacterium]